MTSKTTLRRLREEGPNYLFILPQLLLFIVFLAWPVVRGIQISLNDWKIMAVTQRFIGTANYAELLRDPNWWLALRNSFVFTGLVLSINTVLALVVAANLKQNFRGRNFFRVAYYLPSVLSVTVVGVIAFRVWDPEGGLLNYFVVTALGQPPIRFWAGGTEMWILALTTVWWTFGFPMLVFLAGLNGIPEGLYEAAKIDGAGGMQAFFRITLPLLTPTLLFILSMQFITHMQMFGQAYQMAEDNPNVQPVFVYMFTTAWKFFRFGYASAMGVVLTVIIIVVTRVLFSLLGKRYEY
jgi:multiple sugar transport system permease protein